jgi:hypothetical protein
MKDWSETFQGICGTEQQVRLLLTETVAETVFDKRLPLA